MSSQDQSWISSSDDNGRENFRRKLLIIDSNLGEKEVEQLKFLCQDFVSYRKLEGSSSASDIFNHLIAEELLSEKDTFFLAELLCAVKPSLLKHLNYTKEQVKSLLPTQKKVSLFRYLLYELSESIDSEMLKSMIFLLKDTLPNAKMTSLSFLGHLEKQAKIDADNLTLLEKLFTQVVPCFLRKIEKYKREKEAEQSKLRASEVAVPASAPEEYVVEATGGKEDQEEGILRSSDIEQILQALPFCNSAVLKFRHGFPGALPLPKEVYRMDHKFRGYCVIINNHNFTTLTERQGTNKDAESLKDVFKWLGFYVDKQDDVTKAQLEEILQKYKSHPDHAEGDCFVFCVLSHGEFGAVYSSDAILIPIQEITSHFTALQCPGLLNKPKLFFIQACQGEEIQSSVSIEADAINSEPIHPSLQDTVPIEADFLVGMATVPGYVSFRHKTEGSWYIQSLCYHLRNLVPRQEDILSILTVVNNDVSQRGVKKKQIPRPAYTLRKKVIFPVPSESFH
ncbi:caspase-10 isoform X2 [Saccopteryx bilineata]|uniref:caspase-10 isoform X2 n=1 Tax=Saccopteryx bilineata TaxID=59482 RepID=UPI00338E8C0B